MRDILTPGGIVTNKQTHLFCFTVQKKYILNIKWSNLWLLNVEVYYFPLMDSRLKSVLNSTVGILIVQVVNTFDLLSSSNCQDVDMLVSFYLVWIVNLRCTYTLKIVCRTCKITHLTPLASKHTQILIKHTQIYL